MTRRHMGILARYYAARSAGTRFAVVIDGGKYRAHDYRATRQTATLRDTWTQAHDDMRAMQQVARLHACHGTVTWEAVSC